jgi:hypothetical protein
MTSFFFVVGMYCFSSSNLTCVCPSSFAVSGSNGIFQHAKLDSTSLSSAFSSLLSSLQSSRTRLTQLAVAGDRKSRAVQKEQFQSELSSVFVDAREGWDIFLTDVSRYQYQDVRAPRKNDPMQWWKKVDVLPSGVAVRRKCFAEGAERYAYHFATLCGH